MEHQASGRKGTPSLAQYCFPPFGSHLNKGKKKGRRVVKCRGGGITSVGVPGHGGIRALVERKKNVAHRVVL